MIIKCRVCGKEGSIVKMRKHLRDEHPLEYSYYLDQALEFQMGERHTRPGQLMEYAGHKVVQI